LYAQNKYIITQPRTNFVFDFKYQDESEVKVYINGVIFTDFSFLDTNTLQFDISPNTGSVVIIRRETSLDHPETDFEAGSTLKPEELDKAVLQLFNISQEIHDREGITLGLDDKFDAQGKQIKNLADPVDPNDAATMRYADGGNLEVCQEQANIATQKANEAANSAEQAANSAIQAGTVVDYEGEDEPTITKALMKWHKPSEHMVKIRNLTNDGWINFIDSSTCKIVSAINSDLAKMTGSVDYIAEGLKISYGTDLQCQISPGITNINKTSIISTTPTTVNLNPRKSSMIYCQNNSSTPTFGAIDAVLPSVYYAGSYSYASGAWTFNTTGNIQSLVGNNDAISHGTLTQVEGWIDYAMQGNGVDGYWSFSNTMGWPGGGSDHEINLVITAKVTGTNQTLINGVLYINTSNNLCVYNSSGTAIDTGYTLETGKTYYIVKQYEVRRGQHYLFVNGVLVYKATGYPQYSFGSIFGSGTPTTGFSSCIIYYVDLWNTVHSASQIAKISNQLCLPCNYTDFDSSYPINPVDSNSHVWKFDSGGLSITDEFDTLNGIGTATYNCASLLGLGSAKKFDGVNSYATFGSYAFSSDFTFIAVIYNMQTIGTAKTILSNRDSGGTQGNNFYIDATGKLNINGTAISNSIIPNYQPVFIADSYNASKTMHTTYINSIIPDGKFYYTSKTNSNVLLFAKDAKDGQYWNGIFEYIAIIPRALSQYEIASQYYNVLMNYVDKNIVTDILPTNSISLGFIQTDSTKVTQYNDSDYSYTRNEGITNVEGNKRIFLGWKYFGAVGVNYWKNLLGRENIHISEMWFKKDLMDMKHSVINIANVCVQDVNTEKIKINFAATNLVAATGSYTGNAETSGWVGIWAEVM
jgi:filamentous hemagglutinin family protein